MISDKSKKKLEILLSSYRIIGCIKIYYPKPKKGEDLFDNPEDEEILTYVPENIPRNSYEIFYSPELQIGLAIFSFGKNLYIRPEFSYFYPNFYISFERILKWLGLKNRKMNTPFSCGAIPANMEWISTYRRLKTVSDERYNSFSDDMVDYDYYYNE